MVPPKEFQFPQAVPSLVPANEQFNIDQIIALLWKQLSFTTPCVPKRGKG